MHRCTKLVFPITFQNSSAAEHMENEKMFSWIKLFFVPLLSRMFSHFPHYKKNTKMFKLNIYMIALSLINAVIPMDF
jgi:hypothetical protein